LSFLASDGTATAEMFCFDNIARQIITKPCEAMLKSMPHTTTNEITIPPDLALIVSLKFTFRVTLTDDSYNGKGNTFRIISIVEKHGRQHSLPQPPENVEEQGSSTPLNTASITLQEESPSAAMERLTTMTSPNVSNLHSNITLRDICFNISLTFSYTFHHCPFDHLSYRLQELCHIQ
jgi:hypothetical protein